MSKIKIKFKDELLMSLNLILYYCVLKFIVQKLAVNSRTWRSKIIKYDCPVYFGVHHMERSFGLRVNRWCWDYLCVCVFRISAAVKKINAVAFQFITYSFIFYGQEWELNSLANNINRAVLKGQQLDCRQKRWRTRHFSCLFIVFASNKKQIQR
jgi:hypothetical protein